MIPFCFNVKKSTRLFLEWLDGVLLVVVLVDGLLSQEFRCCPRCKILLFCSGRGFFFFLLVKEESVRCQRAPIPTRILVRVAWIIYPNRVIPRFRLGSPLKEESTAGIHVSHGPGMRWDVLAHRSPPWDETCIACDYFLLNKTIRIVTHRLVGSKSCS